MNEPFGIAAQDGSRQTKSEAVARIVNAFLEELIKANTVFTPDQIPFVRPRAAIAILGYGNDTVKTVFSEPLSTKAYVNLSELDAHPLSTVTLLEKVPNDDGTGVLQISVEHPIWLRAQAQGNTPMVMALKGAREIGKRWIADGHQTSYPPVIINITDGEANDMTWSGELEATGAALTRLATDDGTALLFTVHLTDQEVLPLEYPASPDEFAHLTGDDYTFAQTLFEMSSTIPETAYASLSSLIGRTLPPGAKGFIYQGNGDSILSTLQFASRPAFPIRNLNQ
jgi:hypothetical protein